MCVRCPVFIFYNHALSVIELNRNLNAALRKAMAKDGEWQWQWEMPNMLQQPKWRREGGRGDNAFARYVKNVQLSELSSSCDELRRVESSRVSGSVQRCHAEDIIILL